MAAGYQSISEAITAAADGTVINIGPGIYRERLIFEGTSITLQASPKVSPCKLRHLRIMRCDCILSSLGLIEHCTLSECLSWEQQGETASVASRGNFMAPRLSCRGQMF